MPIVKAKPLKNKKPLVTAIIPCRNEERHIGNCIDSVLNQSYKNVEIIVVENGNSTDRTYEIAKEYAKKHKNVRAYSIPGIQKGPGNALIFGLKKARGKIIMPVGADLTYGPDYIKEGIVPVIKGESVGTNHKEERCKNAKNLWARAFFYRRSFVNEQGLSKVFTLIRRDYLEKYPWDPSLGYADDQTIYRKVGTEFLGVDTELYHANPDSLKEVWEHASWVGKSMQNPWKVALGLFILPFYAAYKTIVHLKRDFYIKFIPFLPVYYSIRYFAYFKESIKKIFN